MMSSSTTRFGGSSKGSFFVAFGMGAVAALLAGACVAPVVIQVIVFSSNLYATGTTQALVLPFVLGLGMALPWPIAGGGLSVMPKPGPWMNKVKHVFGVFILATAAYYSFLSYELFSQYWVDADEVADSAQELLEEGWHASLAAGLEEALAEDKLVLYDQRVDFQEAMPVLQNDGQQAIVISGDEPLRRECEHFLECVTTRRTPLTDAESGVRVLQVLEACQASLEQNGRPVSLDER